MELRHQTVRDQLVADMQVSRWLHPGVQFPRTLFTEGSLHQRIAAYELAFELATEVLGTTWLDISIAPNHVRFAPRFTGMN